MNIHKALTWANKELAEKSNSPQLDSEVLLVYASKKNKEFILTHPETELGFWPTKKFKTLIKKRKHGQPISYLIGNKEFFKLNFFVNKHVLIPRPETEIMVSAVYEVAKYHPEEFIICDIGTGSGNIAITLATYLPQTSILASDISDDALRVAQKNAKIHKIKNIKFIHGNLWLPMENYLNKHLTLARKKIIVTANLPYLTNTQITNDLKFEPEIALHGGEDGLELYKNLFKQIMLSNITPHHIFIEINPEQKIPTLDFQRNLLKIYSERIIQDLSGNDRCLHFINLTDDF